MKKLFLALTLSLVSISLNAQYYPYLSIDAQRAAAQAAAQAAAEMQQFMQMNNLNMNYYGTVPSTPNTIYYDAPTNNSQQSQQNSYQQTTRNRNCYACNGSRQCQICKGTGKKEIASYTRKKEGLKPAYMRCDACGGSGKCQGCH